MALDCASDVPRAQRNRRLATAGVRCAPCYGGHSQHAFDALRLARRCVSVWRGSEQELAQRAGNASRREVILHRPNAEIDGGGR